MEEEKEPKKRKPAKHKTAKRKPAKKKKPKPKPAKEVKKRTGVLGEKMLAHIHSPGFKGTQPTKEQHQKKRTHVDRVRTTFYLDRKDLEKAKKMFPNRLSRIVSAFIQQLTLGRPIITFALASQADVMQRRKARTVLLTEQREQLAAKLQEAKENALRNEKHTEDSDIGAH